MPVPSRAPLLGVLALVALVAAASLGGLLWPAAYARETANWAAQAVGQDWGDLLLAVPWLAVTGALAWRGSLRAALLAAGGALYVFYEFVIYAFGVHFNGLFLVYCATLGVAFFTLAGVALRFARLEWRRLYLDGAPLRATATTLLAIGTFFTLAWLSEIVPALARGTLPASTAEAGAITNPVHVIDLAVILPLHVVAGVALLRRRPVGLVLAPVLLGFGVLMSLSIAGMMLVMRARGLAASFGVVGAMTALGVATAVVLAALLRKVRDRTLA
jgi:hypothetical protein